MTCCGAALFPVPAGRTASSSTPSVKEEVIDIDAPDRRTQRMLYLSPNRARATLVMLPGGSGNVGIAGNGSVAHDENFVIRTRMLWAARGYAVLIPDAVAGVNLRGARSSQAYGTLVARMVATAHRLARLPVVLLGTSQGTIAATNGAAIASHDPQLKSLVALVLTETVSKAGFLSDETVFDAHPAAVHLPTLIVANEDDRCEVAPPDAAGQVAAAFLAAPQIKVVRIHSGLGRDERSCGSRSPHGYYGIDGQVVDLVDKWIETLPPRHDAR